jgi:hypothetical protein
VKGCKRHILVDSLGYLLVVIMIAANVSEGAGLHLLPERAAQLGVDLTSLCKIVVCGGYVSEKLVRWVMDSWGGFWRKFCARRKSMDFAWFRNAG